MKDVKEQLQQLLAERILVLDGSWGVLIQRDVRGEEAYRGERFRDHPRDVAGDPDLLNLTRPEVILDIHRRTGNSHFVGVFSYAGMPYDEAERNMRLFAKDVMPELQKLALTTPAARRGSTDDGRETSTHPLAAG